MKRALIVASVASMIEQFNMNNIKILKDLGYKVDVATNFSNPGTISDDVAEKLINRLKSMDVGCFQIDFPRGMGSIKSDKECYKKLKELSKNNYSIVHCHSPIGGVLTRLAFKKSSTKVIYTAHGFHFYKGGPIKSWIIFYPIERYFSRFTDVLLTINNEDTRIANKFSAGKVVQIPGVGIKSNKYSKNYTKAEKNQIKNNLGIDHKSLVLISIGELRDLKNHITGIKALANFKKPAHYIICGEGALENDLKNEVKSMGLEKQVSFMGYVQDAEKYLAISDISLFLSKREGLGLAGLEAMSAGVPLISSYIGGIKDYTKEGKTGFTIENPVDSTAVLEALNSWSELSTTKKAEISLNCRRISADYDESVVNEVMKDVYRSITK